MPFAADFADATLQPAISHLLLDGSHIFQREMDAIVEGMLARRNAFESLALSTCPPPTALARLLAGGVLKELYVSRPRMPVGGAPLLDAAGAALVAGALRANRTLDTLGLLNAGLCRDTSATVTLLDALVGHPSLRVLHINYEHEVGLAALAAGLGAIIAANVPALHTLRVMQMPMFDAGLAPLLDALPGNSHLRELDISYTGALSAEFTRDRLLPAVRANMGLQEFKCVSAGEPDASVAEAIRLVAARPRRS